jgi:hypothetical protein
MLSILIYHFHYPCFRYRNEKKHETNNIRNAAFVLCFFCLRGHFPSRDYLAWHYLWMLLSSLVFVTKIIREKQASFRWKTCLENNNGTFSRGWNFKKLQHFPFKWRAVELIIAGYSPSITLHYFAWKNTAIMHSDSIDFQLLFYWMEIPLHSSRSGSNWSQRHLKPVLWEILKSIQVRCILGENQSTLMRKLFVCFDETSRIEPTRLPEKEFWIERAFKC